MRSCRIFSQEIPTQVDSSNYVCRLCFSSLTLRHEIENESCHDCPAERFKLFKRYKSYHGESKEALIDSISISDIQVKTSKLLSVLNETRKEISENSTQLKKILVDQISSKIKILNDLQSRVEFSLHELRSDIKNTLHLVQLDENNIIEKITKVIISQENLKISKIVKDVIEVEDICKAIQGSRVTVKFKLLDFFKEPTLNHIPLAEHSMLNQVRIYLNRLERIKMKSIEKEVTWPVTGSYIEHEDGLVLFAGSSNSIFGGTNGVWSISYSASNKQQPFYTKIHSFPRIDFHSLEVFDSKIYIIGGTCMEIKNIEFYTNEKHWKTVFKIQKEIGRLGITHSVMIDDCIHFVGNDSNFYSEYNITRNTFKANSIEDGNKMIFCYNFLRFLIIDNKIEVFSNEEILTFKTSYLKELKYARCPGKAKILYPYLYFVTVDYQDNKKPFIVWRISVKNYEVSILNLK